MAVKDIFRRMRPVQLYVVLAMTTLFFLTELVVSHVTHALTLLVDSYHMLCNLIALIGCIATVKYGDEGGGGGGRGRRRDAGGSALDGWGREGADGGGCADDAVTGCHGSDKGSCEEALPSQQRERRLRNTFGWARIDVLVLLIGTVFLASLCFSLVVEALQTLFHIGHSDEMHHPIPVLFVGAAGVLLNGICYLLIGGYTFHQGSFLHVTSTGDVVLERAVSQDGVRQGERDGCGPPSAAVATSYLQAGISGTPSLRQGPREMLRDVVGCILVIVCSLTVYFTDANVAKYADPIISIISAVLLLVLSYPYMKESGLILLQTIPDHINIESLRSRLCDAFAPSVVGVHDLHIWQLTPQRTYATAHVVFINSKEISSVMKQVTEFFHEQGISHVTIQPEFLKFRAISIPTAESRDLNADASKISRGSKVGKSSYTIIMEKTTSGEGVICFLQCAGHGGSCRNLHCCDEAKGDPLALPHHHHPPQVATTNHRYHRRHSLDEVVEHVASDPTASHHLSSSSSPSLVARQGMTTRDEAASCRKAVSDNALEKSTGEEFKGQVRGEGLAEWAPTHPPHTLECQGEGGEEEGRGEGKPVVAQEGELREVAEEITVFNKECKGMKQEPLALRAEGCD